MRPVRSIGQARISNLHNKHKRPLYAAVENLEAVRTSHTPAPELTTTVAPFRAWRGSQLIVAGGPARATMMSSRSVVSIDLRAWIIPAMARAFNH